MQKNRNITILILIIICIYGLFSQFYLKNFGSTYTYIINPIFYIIFAIILKFTITSPYKTKKYKKITLQYILVTSLAYCILLIVSGVFLTYGNNPYSTTFKGVMLNLYSFGTIIFCTEYIRYKLINNVFKKDRNLIFVLIVIVFTVRDIDFMVLKNSLNVYFLFKTIFNTIVPNIIKNILFNYIAIYTDYIPAVVYQLILCLIQWISPYLPNTPWVFTAIIDSVFPLILLMYCRYEVSSKDMLNLYKYSKAVRPTGIVPLTIVIVMVIWFAVGIFPIKPIGIASASMEPNIYVGDLVIVQKCNANDIEVNDIIEYVRKDYSVVHRVIDKYQENGEFFFITKGDNNTGPDGNPVSEDKIKGKVLFKIKYLALPTIWLERLSGRQSYVDVEMGY